jgi:hypothetical protein
MIEVLKQAYQLLLTEPHAPTVCDQLEAIFRRAIAELESQEPVATVTSETGADITMSWWHEPALPVGTKLFTHPPQRTWVGLTEQEVWDAVRDTVGIMPSKAFRVYQAIEAELKQKNHVAQETNS